MQAILYFILASAISFVGSLQPGAVNMSAMATASNGRYRQAVYLAIGGVIPEALFAVVALVASSIIIERREELLLVSRIAAILFLLIGIWLLFKPAKTDRHIQSVSKNALWSGVIFSMLNPQLILYWITVITWMNLHGFEVSQSSAVIQAGFVIGTSVGAFALHCSLVYVCKYYRQAQWIQVFGRHSNRIVGGILISIGSFELISYALTLYAA